MKTTIILPTYNEAENIEKIIPEITRNLKNHDHEILVVDDDSPDRTWEKALQLAEKGYPVKVLLRSNKRRIKSENIKTIPLKKKSLSAAVIEGFKEADGDAFIVMDADGQHPPEHLPQLIEKLKECDLVIGSRYVDGAKIEDWSLYRYIVSRAFTIVAKIFLPPLRSIADVNSGFFAVKADVVKNSVDEYDGYGFKILWEVIIKGRPQKTCEVPITFRNRIAGQSKAGVKIALEGLRNMIKLRKYMKKQNIRSGQA